MSLIKKNTYMQERIKTASLFIIITCLLGTIPASVYSENFDEIIDSQKGIKQKADEQAKKNLTEKTLLLESKNALIMGGEEYQKSCAICHGMNARGKSEYASVLKVAPTDLTQIKKNNNGVFSYSKLYRIIDGREEISSHGSRVMPIWGDRYNSDNWLNMSPRFSETFARGQIFELLLYLESIQD